MGRQTARTARPARAADLRRPYGCQSFARPRDRWPDQSSELLADDFVALAGRVLESGPIDDLDEASAIDDQALPAQVETPPPTRSGGAPQASAPGTHGSS